MLKTNSFRKIISTLVVFTTGSIIYSGSYAVCTVDVDLDGNVIKNVGDIFADKVTVKTAIIGAGNTNYTLPTERGVKGQVLKINDAEDSSVVWSSGVSNFGLFSVNVTAGTDVQYTTGATIPLGRLIYASNNNYTLNNGNIEVQSDGDYKITAYLNMASRLTRVYIICTGAKEQVALYASNYNDNTPIRSIAICKGMEKDNTIHFLVTKGRVFGTYPGMTADLIQVEVQEL